jgi:CDP-diacylglycerol--glycerol-3-phosphate 3-phosphatidyltransferase
MSFSKRAFALVNLITAFRILAAPVLLLLLFTQQWHLFKWLLLVAFLTDLIDGELARRFKVTSVLGSKLDSIGDDLTVFVAMVGMFIHFPDFIRQELIFIIALLALFLLQISLALYRYGKISSFHTYFAKLAAFFQGVFLLSSFFFHQPNLFLFYVAAAITIADLAEEIILVLLIPTWRANVKGLYWVMKERRKTGQ